jgi:hypothetical protein
VFYIQHPDQPSGQIFSITEKKMAEVIGDGERDLENLILDDPRAIAMATTYFDANAERLDHIPAAREPV